MLTVTTGAQLAGREGGGGVGGGGVGGAETLARSKSVPLIGLT